jgi:hypothetical protein
VDRPDHFVRGDNCDRRRQTDRFEGCATRRRISGKVITLEGRSKESSKQCGAMIVIVEGHQSPAFGAIPRRRNTNRSQMENPTCPGYKLPTKFCRPQPDISLGCSGSGRFLRPLHCAGLDRDDEDLRHHHLFKCESESGVRNALQRVESPMANLDGLPSRV